MINAGSGSTINGIINIGSSNTDYISMGAASTPIKLPSLSSSVGSALCRDSGTNNIVVCAAGSSSATLQSAYDQGNAIQTTDARNIVFTLADSTTDSYFYIENQGTTSALVLNDTNAATNHLIEIQSNGVTKMAIDETGAATTSGTLAFYDVDTDITTATDEDLTLVASGSGIIKLNDTVFIADPSALTEGTDALCRNANGEIAPCQANASGVTLQQAYESGNTITTQDDRDIAFTLSDTATDSKFTLTNAGTATAFIINDINGAIIHSSNYNQMDLQISK